MKLQLLFLLVFAAGVCAGVAVICLVQINRERPPAPPPTPEESEL
jgi:hypothetical protein